MRRLSHRAIGRRGRSQPGHERTCMAVQKASPRPPAGRRGPCQKLQAARRAARAAEEQAAARRSAAATAPGPTNPSRSSLRRAHSRSAVMPQRRRSIQARMPCARPGPLTCMLRQWVEAQIRQNSDSRRSTSGEASPQAPKTSPRTGSYVRSFDSTGPTTFGGVPQNCRST